MHKILLLAFFILSLKAYSQQIHGTAFDEKGDLLPFSSILIKGTTQGSTANNQAKFNFSLPAGKYTLVCQHVGYAKQEKEITLNKVDVEITFILTQQKLKLKEVVVKSGDEDAAYEIIRQGN